MSPYITIKAFIDLTNPKLIAWFQDSSAAPAQSAQGKAMAMNPRHKRDHHQSG
jgi:hypothetical protein